MIAVGLWHGFRQGYMQSRWHNEQQWIYKHAGDSLVKDSCTLTRNSPPVLQFLHHFVQTKKQKKQHKWFQHTWELCTHETKELNKLYESKWIRRHLKLKGHWANCKWIIFSSGENWSYCNHEGQDQEEIKFKVSHRRQIEIDVKHGTEQSSIKGCFLHTMLIAQWVNFRRITQEEDWSGGRKMHLNTDGSIISKSRKKKKTTSKREEKDAGHRERLHNPEANTYCNTTLHCNTRSLIGSWTVTRYSHEFNNDPFLFLFIHGGLAWYYAQQR